MRTRSTSSGSPTYSVSSPRLAAENPPEILLAQPKVAHCTTLGTTGLNRSELNIASWTFGCGGPVMRSGPVNCTTSG